MKGNTWGKKSIVLNTSAISGLQMALTVFKLTQRWLFILYIRSLFFFPCSQKASSMEKCVPEGICWGPVPEDFRGMLDKVALWIFSRENPADYREQWKMSCQVFYYLWLPDYWWWREFLHKSFIYIKAATRMGESIRSEMNANMELQLLPSLSFWTVLLSDTETCGALCILCNLICLRLPRNKEMLKAGSP